MPVLFILTTNEPESLEAALAARPGRVDSAIEFPLPDADGRAKLLDLYRGRMSLPAALVADIVERTEGVSPAFLKELARRIAQHAHDRDGGASEASARDVDGALQELLFEGGKLNAVLLGVQREA